MTTYSFPQPQDLTFERWAGEVMTLNPTLVNAVDPTAPWRSFAGWLAQIIPQAPRPDFFRTWQTWVGALIQATEGQI